MMRLLLVPLLAFLPQRAHAGFLDRLCDLSPDTQGMCDAIRATFPRTEGGNQVAALALVAIQYLLTLIAMVAVVVIVYAGLTMVMAGGDDGKVGNAKKMVTYAVIGLVLAILADVAVAYVAGVVSGIAGA